MTETQIKCFMVVVEEQSYSRAANALYVSQPAISKNISRLEEELGFSLFDSRSVPLTVTEAGHRLYSFWKSTGEAQSALLDELRASSSRSNAPLRLGCPDTWTPAALSGLTGKLSAAGIAVQPSCFKLSELMQRLSAGNLDLVLTHALYTPAGVNIASIPVSETGLGILYSSSLPDCGGNISAFRNRTFYVYDADIQHLFEGLITGVCREYGGFTPTIKNTGRLQSALFEVAAGNGVMLFTDWDNEIHNRLYRYCPIPETMPLRLYYASDKMTPRLQAVLDCFRTDNG